MIIINKIKQIVKCVLIFIFLLFSVIWCPSLAEQTNEGITIGDHVYLGLLEQDGDSKNGKEPISWTVIDVDDNYCMLITDRIIAHKAFDDFVNLNTNWSTSTIRSWMNTYLFIDIFSELEQAMIVSVKTDESGEYINVYEATDRVFLLSKEQAKHYLFSNKARVVPSEQMDFSIEQDAYHREEWWLRTSYSETKKSKEPKGVAVGSLKDTSEMKKELGIRPVIVVQRNEIEVRPLQLPERDEYSYLLYRVFEKTAPMSCADKLLDKTAEYLSAHYDKAFRLKIRRSNHYTYYVVNTSTGETLIYDDKPNSFTPSSYSITVETNVDRFSKDGDYETIDMSTAARSFFD